MFSVAYIVQHSTVFYSRQARQARRIAARQGVPRLSRNRGIGKYEEKNFIVTLPFIQLNFCMTHLL